MKLIPLTQGQHAMVDDADYEELSRFKWCAHRNSKKVNNPFYVVRGIRLPSGKRTMVLMHRVLLDAPANIQVDHVDGNPLNNQRSNLRLASASQNQHNRAVQKNNTSGYKGVSWHKTHCKWRAKIRYAGKYLHLGYFDTAEEAAEHYDFAAVMYHREFAQTNGFYNYV